jgi:hypothetical protein
MITCGGEEGRGVTCGVGVRWIVGVGVFIGAVVMDGVVTGSAGSVVFPCRNWV